MWIERRWFFPGIAVSVLLNVFLIGIVAGHLYVGSGPKTDRVALVPASRVRALPPDERKKFLDAMAARRTSIAAARKTHQAARHALEVEIAAPTFDPARVRGDFASLRQAGTALQEQSHAALVEALAALLPASRAALVAHPFGEDEPDRH